MKYIKYLLVLTVITSLTACFPDNDKAFDGPSVTEFKPTLKTVKVTAAAGSADALIQLVGPQLNADLTIPFTIDPTGTAVAGTHYTLSGSSVTLKANSSSTTIPITLIPGSVTASTGVKLIINLGTASNGTPANPNFSKYTLTIVP